ncbi:unnamed protein product [Amoebophrya sp. A25]|nr:unnamed protein product [Amoebophrya sp. A25]|eukprot:GSA25T00022061001.1
MRTTSPSSLNARNEESASSGVSSSAEVEVDPGFPRRFSSSKKSTLALYSPKNEENHLINIYENDNENYNNEGSRSLTLSRRTSSSSSSRETAYEHQENPWRTEMEAMRLHLQTLIRIASAEQDSTLGGSGGMNPLGGMYDDYGPGGMFGREELLYGGRGGLESLYGGYPFASGAGAGRSSGRVIMQHTGDMLCRSPQCSRNWPLCRRTHSCCSDLMFVMLSDVCELLERLRIPYVLLYGTLLGAVRDGDIIPHTQDMDLVVDKRYWELFAHALHSPDTLDTFIARKPDLAKLVQARITAEKHEEEEEAQSLQQRVASSASSTSSGGEETARSEGKHKRTPPSSATVDDDMLDGAVDEEGLDGDSWGTRKGTAAEQMLVFAQQGQPGESRDTIFHRNEKDLVNYSLISPLDDSSLYHQQRQTRRKMTTSASTSPMTKRQWRKWFVSQGLSSIGGNAAGRRYNFGVDQWESKVARVCADYPGFASTQFKPSSEVKSDPLNNLDMFGSSGRVTEIERGVDYHLDFYDVSWWVFADLMLADCASPMSGGTSLTNIRGRPFSVPLRPRACVEKLYGADWRKERRGLNGVN